VPSPDSRIDEAVLVAADIDGLDPLEAEVPLQVGVQERRNKAATGSVHVDGGGPPAGKPHSSATEQATI
jgi:hypothetical protein